MKFVDMKSLSDCVDWIVLREMGQRTKMLYLITGYMSQPFKHTQQYSMSKRPPLCLFGLKFPFSMVLRVPSRLEAQMISRFHPKATRLSVKKPCSHVHL